MNQQELEANTCNRRQARENECEQVTTGFRAEQFSVTKGDHSNHNRRRSRNEPIAHVTGVKRGKTRAF